MEALLHLRPATLQDLTYGGGLLIWNKVYFEKSLQTGLMEGPYVTLTGDDWSRDIILGILYKMVYVPHYEATAETVPCTMVFKQAAADDLKEHGSLKYNFSYYLQVHEVLHGPFILTKRTVIQELKQQLEEQRVYVLEHKSQQHFREINNIRKAS